MNIKHSRPCLIRILTALALTSIALAVFWLMGNMPTIDPTSIGWIMDSRHTLGSYSEYPEGFLIDYDTAQHYMAWEFFRFTPWWQFPLGLNPNCGLEISSSIVYTDSIPLAAFFFRFFQSLLPMPFQYLGMWILMCYLAQAFLGYRLATLLTPHRLPCVLMAAFFVLSPILLWRSNCQVVHASHWLILAGLLLYFKRDFAHKCWMLLFVVASLISVYYLPMLGALLLADVVRRAIDAPRSLRQTAFSLIEAPILSVFILYLIGGFAVSGFSMCRINFDLHRINLIAAFDPDLMWSVVLPNLPSNYSFYEGFAYLGSGVLLLLCVGIILTVFMRRPASAAAYESDRLTKTHAICLTIYAFVFFVISLSYKTSIGTTELFEYSPGIFAPLCETFRASGRMFWPAFYCIYLGMFAMLVRRIPWKPLSILMIAVLIFQLWDMQKVFAFFHDFNVAEQPYRPALRGRFWDEAGKRFKNVRLVFPTGEARPYWQELAEFAYLHKMGINSFYLARWDSDKKDAADKQLWSVLNGEQPYSPDTLYVIVHDNPAVWKLAQKRAGAQDLAIETDGLKMIAPGMKFYANDIQTTASN